MTGREIRGIILAPEHGGALKIRRRKCPPLVGRSEAAAILGVAQNNLRRMADVPEPLNERAIPGFEVSATTLWPRAELEEVAAKRAERG